MDNVIKLPAQQALFNSNNRLVDLILPGNSGVYDLSKTYVAVTCTADNLDFTANLPAGGALAQTNGLPANTAVPDVRLSLKHNNSMATIYDECAVPIEALVRNCSMFSANRGKLEDIRRADTLRATMKAYTADIEDIEDSSIGGFAPMAKSNPWASGRFAQLVGVGDTATKMKSHELRINLKDIFNFGAVEAYDSSAYGNLHIHLELNLNKLELKQALSGTAMWDRYYHNQTANTPSYPVTHKYSEALPRKFLTTDTNFPLTEDSIEMAAEYQSLEDSPFYVNQILSIDTTYTQAGGGTLPTLYPTDGAGAKWAVVRSITWDKTTNRITLGFGAGSAVFTISAAPGTHPLLVNREVVGLAATSASMGAGLTIQSVELTAVRRPDMDAGPAQNQYTQYITQSDQWQNSKSLNRSYYLPPQTTNAYIMMPSSDTTGGAPAKFSDILGCARLEHYRFTLNGESVTNRVVPYMPTPAIAATPDTKCDRGSSLHYTLISETMMNAGVRYNSLNESVFDQNIPNSTDIPVTGAGLVGWTNLADCPKKACYMLALPVPISNDQTQLTIELEGDFQASSGELHIFSEVRSVA